MKQNKTYQIVMGALFAAFIFVVATIAKVPTPTGGVIQIADSIIVVAGILLGPVIGGLASGIGAGLFDLANGYGQYAPGTFVIKFAMAAAAYYLYKALPGKKDTSLSLSVKYVFSSVLAGLIMIGGYFVFERLLLGDANAIAAIVPNIIQATGSTIIGVPIFLAIHKAYTIVAPKTVESR